ncbi:hypothetical protein QIH96_13265 [Bradyrhizobium japonicum]|uniref:hypothetical protein n=1 Tax=Bradyrhizobium japonicum TaxID=375 RepID=UPI00271509F9|nr:hypothetical protein [Bradyrhizobium japonicum]WLB66071.1 hypothetical protein QIH96_13265 [Bradyrhizobium japonicum]
MVETVVDSGTTNDQKEKPNDFWSEWQEYNFPSFLIIFQLYADLVAVPRGTFQGPMPPNLGFLAALGIKPRAAFA